jgi:hypothetical protein
MPDAEKVRQAVMRQYNAEDVKLAPADATGRQQVFAYGMLPETTILGWFPLGDLDELERELRERGEL